MINELASLRNAVIGEFKDTIIHKDGRVEEGKWNKNLIVNDIISVIACALKGDQPLKYWAIGQGTSGWDDNTPPSPSNSDTQLVGEIARKVIDAANITYIDGSGNVTASVTNRIQITLTFDYAEALGSWREFGLVGGNATATANSGKLINHRTHALIVKTNSIAIQRQIRFTFSN